MHTFPVYIVVPEKSAIELNTGHEWTYIYFNLFTIGILNRRVVTLNPDILDELSCRMGYEHLNNEIDNGPQRKEEGQWRQR